jgi:hypothetical protein
LVSLYGTNNVVDRTWAIHAKQDDLGLNTSNTISAVNGNAGQRVACGIVRIQVVDSYEHEDLSKGPEDEDYDIGYYKKGDKLAATVDIKNDASVTTIITGTLTITQTVGKGSHLSLTVSGFAPNSEHGMVSNICIIITSISMKTLLRLVLLTVQPLVFISTLTMYFNI